jgi:hypothetical protein
MKKILSPLMLVAFLFLPYIAHGEEAKGVEVKLDKGTAFEIKDNNEENLVKIYSKANEKRIEIGDSGQIYHRKKSNFGNEETTRQIVITPDRENPDETDEVWIGVDTGKGKVGNITLNAKTLILHGKLEAHSSEGKRDFFKIVKDRYIKANKPNLNLNEDHERAFLFGEKEFYVGKNYQCVFPVYQGWTIGDLNEWHARNKFRGGADHYLISKIDGFEYNPETGYIKVKVYVGCPYGSLNSAYVYFSIICMGLNPQ